MQGKETYTPEKRDSSNGVNVGSAKARESSPDSKVDVVQRWQNRPESIDLGVIAIDFGEDDEKHGQEEGERDRSRKGVGRKINLLQCVHILSCERWLKPLRKGDNLRQERSYGVVERGAVCERLDLGKWESHLWRRDVGYRRSRWKERLPH